MVMKVQAYSRRVLQMIQPRDIAQDRSNQRKTLHLYRALLRECTYLPDAAARDHLHDRVKFQFRPFLLPQNSPYRISSPKQRSSRDRIRDAQKQLRYLQRANGGHTRHLTKILEMTYGRLGPRREEYLEPFKPTHYTRELASPKSEIIPVSEARKGDVPIITLQHQALIRSQKLRPKATMGRNLQPSLAPTVPETNAWGRPMPVIRVRNIHRRWYKETLNRTSAPLPKNVWERLHGLVKGEIHWEGPVKRRSRPPGEYRWQYDVGLENHMDERKISRPHTISRRYMQKLWSKILAQCPRMEVKGVERQHVDAYEQGKNVDDILHDEKGDQTNGDVVLVSDPAEKKVANEGGEWKVHWMDVQDQRDIVFALNKPLGAAMFSGVDGKGRRFTQ